MAVHIVCGIRLAVAHDLVGLLYVQLRPIEEKLASSVTEGFGAGGVVPGEGAVGFQVVELAELQEVAVYLPAMVAQDDAVTRGQTDDVFLHPVSVQIQDGLAVDHDLV